MSQLDGIPGRLTQSNGVTLPARKFINFLGNFFLADNPSNKSTDVGILVTAPPLVAVSGLFSTGNQSANKQIVGAFYFVPSKYPVVANYTQKTYFHAILQTTQAGNAANLDLFDYNGITNGGVPRAIPSAALSDSSGNIVHTSIELPALEALAGLTQPGVILARIWLTTLAAGQDAIVYSSSLEPKYQ